MNTRIQLSFALLLFLSVCQAQQSGVGIGTLSPDSSAALDISASGQGVLIPRMDSTTRLSITSPAVGLMVFDSTTNGFWFFGSTGWLQLETNDAINAGAYFCLDSDTDGFGDPTRPVWVPQGVLAPPGFVADCSDPDDADDAIFIGAPCDVENPDSEAIIDSNGFCVDTSFCQSDSCGIGYVQLDGECVWGTCWQSGIATVYGSGQGGACGWDNSDLLIQPFNGRIAAVGPGRWGSGLCCGDVYDIVCSSGTNTNNCQNSTCNSDTVRVMVVDYCPECDDDQFDLSTTAWDDIISSAPCITDIEFRRVGHEYGVGIQIDVVSGSNQWFLQYYPKFSNKKIISMTVTSNDGNQFNADHEGNQGFWTVNPNGTPLELPISITFTAIDGSVLPAADVITSYTPGNQDSGVNFDFN